VPTESDSHDITKISYYAHWTKESVRYNDTDCQGHVNNAVFVTFLEAGRDSLLYNPKERALTPEGSSFVRRRQLRRDGANRLGSHRRRNAQVAALTGSDEAGVEKMAASKRGGVPKVWLMRTITIFPVRTEGGIVIVKN
jgi:hypothetical protein